MAFEVLPLTTIGIIIIIAIFLSILVKKIHLNPVLGFIIAGFLLGPFLLNFLHPEDPLVIGFGEMGLFILLFYLGLEFSLEEFIKAGSATLGLAAIDMTLSVIAGFAVLYFLGFSLLFSAVVGFMLFCTSTAIVAKFVIDKGILRLQPTQLAISILILQDFLGILLLVFITTLTSKGPAASGNALDFALIALVFAVSTFYVVNQLSKYVEEWLLKNNFGHTEVTLYAVGVGLVAATLGSVLGLSTTMGAYFAGFALGATKSGSKIKEDVHFLRDFFLVFFFVAFGTTIFYDFLVKAVVIPETHQLLFFIGLTLLLAVLAIIAHGIAIVLFGPLFGLTRNDASLTAIFLTPLGEFVIIIATSAAKILEPAESGLLAPIAFLLIAVTVILFMPLFNSVEWHRKIFGKLPILFKEKQPAITSLKPHSPFTIEQLRIIGINIFILFCLIIVTFSLYDELPRFGVPLLYSRQITTIIIFSVFASVPLLNSFKAFKNLVKASRHHSLETI